LNDLLQSLQENLADSVTSTDASALSALSMSPTVVVKSHRSETTGNWESLSLYLRNYRILGGRSVNQIRLFSSLFSVWKQGASNFNWSWRCSACSCVAIAIYMRNSTSLLLT
jgi:hypothetical protein